MKNIVILASGSGSNAENIINFFENDPEIKVAAVLTNNSKAQVIERCKRLNIPCLFFNRAAFSRSTVLVNTLKSLKPELLVLAGFLWKIPPTLISSFENKIINIHPALLPKYGGKGMYGSHVHEAVKANNETETGITIHYVNENYDEGAIIHQASVAITELDTPESIAKKVHQLEYGHFPKIIAQLLKGTNG